MKYRIKQEEGKFRAEIGKENKFGKLNWIPIENDTRNLCYRTYLYNTIDEAVEACKQHHVKNGYDQIGQDIVKTFEL